MDGSGEQDNVGKDPFEILEVPEALKTRLRALANEIGDEYEVNAYAEFAISVLSAQNEDGDVRNACAIATPSDERRDDLWRSAAAYIVAHAAARSTMGYEAAIEEIVRQAMRYKTISSERVPLDDT